MEKVLKIDGMSCNHCVNHVTKALKEISGVTDVSVSLENKTASVQMSSSIDDNVFKKVVEDAGFELMT